MSKYNRLSARQFKKSFDRNDNHLMGDWNVIAKKAKAANVEGFDRSMYSFDQDQKFDRDRYRSRKQEAKEMNPEWTRRQRKAYALMDNEGSDSDIIFQKIGAPDYSINIPRKGPRVGVVEVGDAEFVGAEGGKRIKRTERGTISSKMTPSNWNQFYGTIMDKMRADGSFRGDQDSRAAQAWIAGEYRRYMQDPTKYEYAPMSRMDVSGGYQGSPRMASDEKYLREVLGTANTGYGYYDPKAGINTSKGFDPVSYEKVSYIDPETGAIISSQTSLPNGADLSIKQSRATLPTMEGLSSQKWSDGLSRAILATEMLPALQFVGAGVRDIPEATQMFTNHLRNIYSGVSQNPTMVQAGRGGWSQTVGNPGFGRVVRYGSGFNGTYGTGISPLYTSEAAAYMANPGARLSGEVIRRLPEWLRWTGRFKNGGKL